MPKKSVTIKAAWIAFSGAVLAAVICVVFTPRPQDRVQLRPTDIAKHEKETPLQEDTTVNELSIPCDNNVYGVGYKESPKVVPLLEMTYSIAGLHNSGNEWREVLVWDDASLYSGDCFKIGFTTNQDCFVYVLLYGSGGIAQCLFPHQKIYIGNYVKGGLLYTVPDGDNWYYLDEVPGTETLYIVACYEPMDDIAGLLKKIELADSHKRRALSDSIRGSINSIQARALESDKHVVSERGVSAIAPKPIWNMAHEGKVVETITNVVRGNGSIVKVVSFKHK